MILIEREFVTRAESASGSDDLVPLLQRAMQLEHATIPPYLAAEYSLKPPNATIKNKIAGIVREEMLHMTIAGNVLNAIGGRPEIDSPDFIPVYPRQLPMSIGQGLVVGIVKFSKDLVRNVFMKIEQPEHPIPIPTALAAVAEPQYATIGGFYAALKAKILELGPVIFTGEPARQVVAGAGFPSTQLFPITDPQSAVRGLNLIVTEGEGTTTVPFDVEGLPAHYYRFEEILRGLTLRTDPSPPGYKYDLPEIPFNAAEVWDFPDDPKMADYPPGSAERKQVEQFNVRYSNLLRTLQRTFDGQPQQIGDAEQQMFGLRVTALALLRTTDPHTNRQLAPTFEFLPA